MGIYEMIYYLRNRRFEVRILYNNDGSYIFNISKYGYSMFKEFKPSEYLTTSGTRNMCKYWLDTYIESFDRAIEKENEERFKLAKLYLNSIYGKSNYYTEERSNNMKIGNCELSFDKNGNTTFKYIGNNTSNRTEIKDVIFNPPATIIKWTDGTKTVVKTQNGECYDPEKGFAMAVTKKYFGNEGNYYNDINKWVSKYKVKQVSNVVSEIKHIIKNSDSYKDSDFDITYDVKNNKYTLFIGDNLGIKITYKGIYNILNSSFINWDTFYDYKRMGSVLNIWPKD